MNEVLELRKRKNKAMPPAQQRESAQLGSAGQTSLESGRALNRVRCAQKFDDGESLLLLFWIRVTQTGLPNSFHVRAAVLAATKSSGRKSSACCVDWYGLRYAGIRNGAAPGRCAAYHCKTFHRSLTPFGVVVRRVARFSLTGRPPDGEQLRI